ncbi:rhodanese-like domain-containing protein [Chengkuizengella axinellae]|uniref:Rhodanese-like domain-containing protein n=1 Tax=Chengkuizengella axinellae TaxID=3064388 RepID=A0ABT9IXC3_9BACL|nr:rhodanese-like domain-containing protein [Chengkuizengella sp. 2205SS18-9]MDP5273767.1 rhodanese-like domain-containing protein [Chengkuizengella sp. 2205SS18-9]
MNSYEISAADFFQKLKNKSLGGIIVDVREKMEWDYYHLDDAILHPMNTIPEKLTELPKDRTLYILCAHGIRSQHVCNFLINNGFDNVKNVSGGISAVAMLQGFQYD